MTGKAEENKKSNIDNKLVSNLPHILKDIWSFAATSEDIFFLINNLKSELTDSRILELDIIDNLSSLMAKQFNAKITGISDVSEHIENVKLQASEFCALELCDFLKGRVDLAIYDEIDYDLTILRSPISGLGTLEEGLSKLKRTIKTSGYLVFDEAFCVRDYSSGENYKKFKYQTYEEILSNIKNQGFEVSNVIIKENFEVTPLKISSDQKLRKKIFDISQKYANENDIFEEYLRDKIVENYSEENNIMSALWLVKGKV